MAQTYTTANGQPTSVRTTTDPDTHELTGLIVTVRYNLVDADGGVLQQCTGDLDVWGDLTADQRAQVQQVFGVVQQAVTNHYG